MKRWTKQMGYRLDIYQRYGRGTLEYKGSMPLVDLRCTSHSQEELSIALRAFFRVGKLDGKSEKRFEEALHALDVDHPGCQVEWRKIFEEDREFNQGEFAECVRYQFLSEREELYDAIGVALYEECGEDTTCSCSQVEAALIVARPTLGEKAQKCAAALFQELGEDKLKISVALKYLSDRSLESSEEELHQGIQRKQQKSDKPGLVGGKVGRQTGARFY